MILCYPWYLSNKFSFLTEWLLLGGGYEDWKHIWVCAEHFKILHMEEAVDAKKMHIKWLLWYLTEEFALSMIQVCFKHV